jgi:hypothetical protein
MVNAREKKHALEFIWQKLEISGRYLLSEMRNEGLIVQEDPKRVDEPKTIEVVVANFLPKAEALNTCLEWNSGHDTYTAPVLYKDGNTAFVRMVERNSSWRLDKSLKHYGSQRINQMLHLRKIEKMILERWGLDNVVYLQPETPHLEEGLRSFKFHPVELDYSHIRPGDQGYGFVQDRESVDYKIPEEKENIEPAAQFKYYTNRSTLRARLVGAPAVDLEKKRQDEITRTVNRELARLSRGVYGITDDPAYFDDREVILLFHPDD